MSEIDPSRLEIYEAVLSSVSNELNSLLGLDWQRRQWEVCIGLIVLRIVDSVLFAKSTADNSFKYGVDSLRSLSSSDLDIATTSDLFAGMSEGLFELANKLSKSAKTVNHLDHISVVARPFQRLLNALRKQDGLAVQLAIPIHLEVLLTLRIRAPFCIVDDFTAKDLRQMHDVVSVDLVRSRFLDDGLVSICTNIVLLTLPIPYRSRRTLMDFDFAKKFGWKDSIRKVTTATGQAANDALKIFTARNRDSIRYTILQHGVNYGTEVTGQITYLDVSIPDRFVSWGWTSSSSIVPGSLHKPTPVRLSGKAEKTHAVLLVLPPMSPQFRHYSTKNEFLQQMLEVREFLRGVYGKVEIRLRGYRTNNPVVIEEYSSLQAEFPKCSFSNESSFLRDSKAHKLVVFGYFSTGYLERISDKLPAVVIDPRLYWSKIPEYKAKLLCLGEEGGLFTQGREAAKLVRYLAQESKIDIWFGNVVASPEFEEIRSELANEASTNRFNYLTELLRQDNA